jgi:prepilin-type N-terminal cleavage/methylation domain-containing protein
MSSGQSDRGFTLLETLIATGILVTAVAGIAQLFVLSVRFTRESGQFGVALVSAQAKVESLRALTYGFDDGGEPITDARLAPSPPSSLASDVAPYADWLDAAGGAVDGPDAAVYVRRWRISTLDEHEPDAIAIEVCVFRAPAAGRGPAGADACLATMRARQP